jgi:hypothetical protein
MFIKGDLDGAPWYPSSWYPDYNVDELAYLVMMEIGMNVYHFTNLASRYYMVLDDDDTIFFSTRKVHEISRINFRELATRVAEEEDPLPVSFNQLTSCTRDEEFLKTISTGAMIGASRKEEFYGSDFKCFLRNLVGHVSPFKYIGLC